MRNHAPAAARLPTTAARLATRRPPTPASPRSRCCAARNPASTGRGATSWSSFPASSPLIGRRATSHRLPYPHSRRADARRTLPRMLMKQESTLVVDADSHVMEPADLWETYLEPEYRDRAIRIVEQDGVEQLVMGGQVILAGTLAGLGGAHVERNRLFSGMKYADGCPPASYDPAARTAMYDDWGVSCGVVFPTIGILPFPNDDPGLSNAYCRAYNTWQAEFAAAAAGRVLPI